MRIGFVIGRLGYDGGTERHAVELLRYLSGRGHRVTVHCVAVDPRVPREGLEIVPLHPRFRRGTLGRLALARAAATIGRRAFDVLQSFGRTAHHDVYRAGGGAHAAYLHRASAPCAQVLPGNLLELVLERAAVAGARRVVCNSEMARRDLLRYHELPPERVRVVRNGVDLQRFRPDRARRGAARASFGVPRGGRVALFLGHGFRRKGLDVAARAFSWVAGSRDRFVVAGRDASARRRLRRVARLLGDRLVVLGPVPSPEEVLPGADATLLPTLYDAAANTTLEALAAGVPPVTSSFDGNAEILPDPRLVVRDPTDEAAFAAALRRAWESGADLGCREAAEHWPVSRNGEAMEALYEELVDER